MTVLQHNIRFLREYLEYTQEEFGDRIGVTGDQVYTFEKRGTKPSLPVLYNICKMTGITVEQLQAIKLDSDSYNRIFSDKEVDFPQGKVPLVEEPEDPYVSMSVLMLQQNKLIEAMHDQASITNKVLQRLADNVEPKIDQVNISLADVLGRIDSVKYDVTSTRVVTLQSLARLEGKSEQVLLKQADNIVTSLLEKQKQQSKMPDKGK